MKIIWGKGSILICFLACLFYSPCTLGAKEWKDTLVVARDGTGDVRSLTEVMEEIRAFMDYKVTVLIKKGIYKEKVVVPSI